MVQAGIRSAKERRTVSIDEAFANSQALEKGLFGLNP